MSVLHAVATVVATPSPSPHVIVKIVTRTITEPIPQAVLKLAQTLGLAAAVAVISLIHQVLVKNKLVGNIQRSIVAAYAVVAAFMASVLNGHVGVSAGDLNVEVTSLFVALGAAFSRYEFLWKAVQEILRDSSTTTNPTASLATDQTPAEG